MKTELVCAIPEAYDEFNASHRMEKNNRQFAEQVENLRKEKQYLQRSANFALSRGDIKGAVLQMRQVKMIAVKIANLSLEKWEANVQIGM